MRTDVGWWVFQIRTVHMGLRWLVERWQMMGNWELLSLRYEREVQLRDKPSFKLVMTWVIVLCGRLEERNSGWWMDWSISWLIDRDIDKLTDKQTILFPFCLCLSICRSVNLNVYLPQSVISVCLLSFLPPRQSVLQSVCPFFFPAVRLSGSMWDSQSACLSGSLSVCLSFSIYVRLSVCLSVCLSGWFSVINWVRNVNWPP